MGNRRFPILIIILAILLTLPSLQVGLISDDYHHKLVMQDSEYQSGLLNSRLDLFRLIVDDPEQIRRIMDIGIFPWWTYPGIKGAFWRPIASLTHYLDYQLWPDYPVLMHVQSILWYAVLVFVVSRFYRQYMGFASLAGLAALLWAIDDAHGMPVCFLANRNTLLSTLFGILALMAHDRWRRNGIKQGMVLGPLFFILSLLSKEEGISTCAYLFAYSMILDQGNKRQRFLALVPYAAIVIVWRILWSSLGYGVANLGIYIDPVREPIRFLESLFYRGPIMLLGQWGLPPSDIHIMIASTSGGKVLWIFSLVILSVLAWMFMPLLKKDRLSRFWALGMILAVIPICTTFTSDRMLFFVGLGAMGLLSQFLFAVFGGPGKNSINFRLRRFSSLLAFILIGIHLMIAPLLMLYRTAFPMMVPKKIQQQFELTGPLDPAVENQDLVVVNPPDSSFVFYAPIIWKSNHYPVPRHTRVLCSSLFRPVRIQRTDSYTLRIRPERGYITAFLEGIFRNDRHPMTLGEEVRLTGMSAKILELTPGRRPAEVSFQFQVPLEDTSLRWLKWENGDFVPFIPPKVGETVVLHSRHPKFSS